MSKRFLVKQFDPTPHLRKISTGKTQITAKPGDHIFSQGDVAENVFYLETGIAKESVTRDRGRIAVVRMVEPGAFFGVASLDDVSSYGTSAIAVTRCEVTAITTTAMRDALVVNPRFNKLFIEYLTHQNTRLEIEKIDLLFNNVQVRLAKQLLMLAHVEEGAPRMIGPEINQELLADMVGTTRPRVNFFLGRFRKLGLVEYGNSGLLVHPRLLKAVLEDSSIFNEE